MNNQQKSQPKRTEKLNVIFHGAFVFDQAAQPGYIHVLIPEIEHHSYRAGSWLGETELRGRDRSRAVVYRLRGVKPGGDRFCVKQDQNLLVRPLGTGHAREVPYATLVFPLPEQITSLLVADIERGSFTHQQELVAKGDQQLATLQVFTYEIENQNALMLRADDGDGHYWEPVLTGDDRPHDCVTIHYINLHIFSAEDHFHKPSNAEEDFNKCTNLLDGLSLRLQTRSLRASGILGGPQVPGVDPRETESLARRTERLARLGRAVLQKDGDPNVVWYGNDALDGEIEACSGFVRCN